MSSSLGLKFLYHTVPGRIILKQLVKPSVSVRMGKFLSTGLSARLVPGYVKKNGIDLSRYEVPAGGYVSFNDFFTRKLLPENRPKPNSGLTAPCDGLLTVLDIDSESNFLIKNSNYSLVRLLKDRELADKFSNGTAFIFRLTPSHYHRYNFCSNGTVSSQKRISGKLHCVRPIALEQLPVFIENSREYVTIESEQAGKLIQMEVGALFVGKISNYAHKDETYHVRTTDEKGYFEFGGSTIIVLTDHRVSVNEAILNRKRNEEGEIPVVIGESLIN
ncbi:phosphatidylserine decarboxylase [Oribacterium sp. P6A1]|uniref:phosphatidylserine decarboxylase n=1 Tax=Oribacterium sp. P6A1 TaxID=1410612 RepID=UPI00056181E3|nr:phosphatidylserine decarboxylase [Oribacterium sp. P6A1]